MIKYENQPNVLPDQLIEKNNEACAHPKTIKLMNCNETMRYHVPNKDIYPEKFAHHLLFIFYPFRLEDELLIGNPPTYQNTLACPSFLSAFNKNRQKFEPYADITEESLANFSHNLQSNQDSYGQIENNETKDTSFSDKNENASDANTNEYSSVPFNALSNQSEESIAANIKSLNINKDMCLTLHTSGHEVMQKFYQQKII